MLNETKLRKSLLESIDIQKSKVASWNRTRSRIIELLADMTEPQDLTTGLEQLNDATKMVNLKAAELKGLNMAWGLLVSSDPTRIIDIDDTAI